MCIPILISNGGNEYTNIRHFDHRAKCFSIINTIFMFVLLCHQTSLVSSNSSIQVVFCFIKPFAIKNLHIWWGKHKSQVPCFCGALEFMNHGFFQWRIWEASFRVEGVSCGVEEYRSVKICLDLNVPVWDPVIIGCLV